MEEITSKIPPSTLNTYKSQLKDKLLIVGLSLITIFIEPLHYLSLKLSILVILENLIIFSRLLYPKVDFKVYETKQTYYFSKLREIFNLNSVLYSIIVVLLKWIITTPLGLTQFKIFNNYTKLWTFNGEFVFNFIITSLLITYTIYSNYFKINNNNNEKKFSFIKQNEWKFNWNLNPYDWLANLYIISNRYLESGPFTMTLIIIATSIFLSIRVFAFIFGFFINTNLFAYNLFDLSLIGVIANIISVAIIKDLIQLHFNLVNYLLYQSIGSDSKTELDFKQLINNIDNQNNQIQIQSLIQLKREIYFNSEFRKQIYQAIAPDYDPSAIKSLFSKVKRILGDLDKNLKLDAVILKKESNNLAVYASDNCNCTKFAQFKPLLSYSCKAITLLKSVSSPIASFITNLIEKFNLSAIPCKACSIIRSTFGPSYSQAICNLYQDYINLRKDWSVKDPIFNLRIYLNPIQKFCLLASVVSDLIYHSAKEDSYGLVQYEVPSLIELLLSICSKLDKISNIKDDLNLERVKITQPLIIELERSINRILLEHGKVFQYNQLPSGLREFYDLKFKN